MQTVLWVLLRVGVCACASARVLFPEVDRLQPVCHLLFCDSSNPIKSGGRQGGRGCHFRGEQTTLSERKQPSSLCVCVCV